MSRLLFVLLLFIAPNAFAKPMHSGPDTIIKRTQAVLAGRVVKTDNGSALLVERVLWDPAGRFEIEGKLQLRLGRIEEGIDLNVNRIAVVLVDETGRPAFAAEPAVSSVADIDVHPLELRGFYAYNAHLTTPAVVSLKGLLTGLKTGRFEDTLTIQLAAAPTGPAMAIATGKMVNGVPKIGGVTAQVSSWDHDLRIRQGKQAYRGRFVGIHAGALVARVLPEDLVAPDLATLKVWRTGLAVYTKIDVHADGAQATLTFTGKTEGSLTAGLWPVAGPTPGTAQVAGIIRQDKRGHRSQTNRLIEGEPPGHGWHIALRASAGILWITLPLDAVDARIPDAWRPRLTPQATVLHALSAGPIAVRFSGIRRGQGTVRMR